MLRALWPILFLALSVVGVASAEDDGWTGPWTGGDCAHCHRANSVEIPDPAKVDDHRGVTRDCQDCHLGGDKEAPYPPDEAHQDLDPLCARCHREGNREGAPVPSSDFTVESQRAWQRGNDARFAEWVGRGVHPDRTDCTSCHQGAGGATAVPAEECTSCHAWLRAEVAQAGFGNTGYQGTMDPETLLQGIKDVDGDGRNHNAIYTEYGCTGFCHNEAVTVAAAEAWGGAMTDPTGGGVDPALPPATGHGHISRCTDCHRVSSPAGGPADLHTTHIPFITAEQALADPDDLGTAACDYCHSAGPSPDRLAGGCYNCHLSGHFPETVYWEMETPFVPTLAVPVAASAPVDAATPTVPAPVVERLVLEPTLVHSLTGLL